MRSCNPRLGRFDSGAVPLIEKPFSFEPAVSADVAAATAVVAALESSFYGQSDFSQADLEDEWADGYRAMNDREAIKVLIEL